jgi:hypothetical protein
MSRYTALLVTDRGVVLYAQHLARLAPEGPAVLAAYRKFTQTASPGVYALCAESDRLTVTLRPPSSLFDGMPARFLISPFFNQRSLFPKPTPPSLYDSVRLRGVASLLTSPDGSELYEESFSSIVVWDGSRLMTPPEDRPAVRSCALGALLAAGILGYESLAVHSNQPLALVNAVAGIVVPDLPGRDAFPPEIKARVADIFDRTCGRKGDAGAIF